MITLKSFDLFCKWVSQNVGLKFKMDQQNKDDIYTDKDGVRRKMSVPPFVSRDIFMKHCKEYLINYQSETNDMPQIEFSNDFKYLKIYKNVQTKRLPK